MGAKWVSSGRNNGRVAFRYKFLLPNGKAQSEAMVFGKVLFRCLADVQSCPSQMKKQAIPPQIPPPVVINKSKLQNGKSA